MNSIIRPPLNPARDRPSDDFDELLRAYFQAEMPKPWPGLKLPASLPQERATLGSWSLLNSRFALAAAVALLMIGSLMLSGAFRTNEPTTSGAKYKNDVATKLKFEKAPK